VNSHRLPAASRAILTALAVPLACGSGSDGAADGDDRSTTTASPADSDEHSTDSTEGTEGNDSDSGGSSELSCESIPSAPVEAVLGAAPAPVEESMMGVTSCEFDVDEGGSLAVSRGESGVYRTAFETMEPLSEGEAASLGENAFFVSGYSSASRGGTKGTTLWVDAGDVIWSFAAQRASGEVDSEALEALAQQMVG
jgi:hypothetical protein